MGGQGEADRVLIARGFWDDVAIGEPLGDLECAGEASAATGQGERFNRQVAALGRDLKGPGGAEPHAAGEGETADQLPICGKQAFRQRLRVCFA